MAALDRPVSPSNHATLRVVDYGTCFPDLPALPPELLELLIKILTSVEPSTVRGLHGLNKAWRAVTFKQVWRLTKPLVERCLHFHSQHVYHIGLPADIESFDDLRVRLGLRTIRDAEIGHLYRNRLAIRHPVHYSTYMGEFASFAKACRAAAKQGEAALLTDVLGPRTESVFGPNVPLTSTHVFDLLQAGVDHGHLSVVRLALQLADGQGFRRCRAVRDCRWISLTTAQEAVAGGGPRAAQYQECLDFVRGNGCGIMGRALPPAVVQEHPDLTAVEARRASLDESYSDKPLESYLHWMIRQTMYESVDEIAKEDPEMKKAIALESSSARQQAIIAWIEASPERKRRMDRTMRDDLVAGRLAHVYTLLKAGFQPGSTFEWEDFFSEYPKSLEMALCFGMPISDEVYFGRLLDGCRALDKERIQCLLDFSAARLPRERIEARADWYREALCQLPTTPRGYEGEGVFLRKKREVVALLTAYRDRVSPQQR